MKVVCFGDSNTYGFDPRGYFGGRYENPWPRLLAKKTGWSVINEGQNGRQIPEGRFHSDADLTIVMLGTNDLLQGQTPQQTADRMERFLLQLQKPVLLIAPPPMIRGSWVPDDELVQRSAALAAYYEETAKKTGALFADSGLWKIPLVFDGVHFSEQGHERFAEALDKYLKKETDYAGSWKEST